MILEGIRRGNATQLAIYLLNKSGGEQANLLTIVGFPEGSRSEHDLRFALRLMGAHGYAHGKYRNLYHIIVAPQKGETLSRKQIERALELLAQNLSMERHAYIVVEHTKNDNQHLHVVFDLVHPLSGCQAPLKFDRLILRRVARQLEREFGLKPTVSRGREIKRWEFERGKRTGIDPRKMRAEVTRMYHASAHAEMFAASLAQIGLKLGKGKDDRPVLRDRAGHVHGLLGRLEGVTREEFNNKFPDWSSFLTNGKEPPLIGRFKTVALQSLPRRSSPSALHRPANHYAQLKMPTKPVLMPAPRPNVREVFKHYGRQLLGRAPLPPIAHKGGRFYNRSEIERAELLAWAWANNRFDVLAQFGIFPSETEFEQ